MAALPKRRRTMSAVAHARPPRLMTAVIAAALWVVLGLAVEHVAGVYEPSEETGRGSGIVGFAGVACLIGWATTIRDWSGRAPKLGRRFLCGWSVAATAAIVLGLIKSLYFVVVWGDFADKMGQFTRRTLQERGANPEQIQSFAAAVERSWQTPNIALQASLGLAMWGGALALALAMLFSGIDRFRSASRGSTG